MSTAARTEFVTTRPKAAEAFLRAAKEALLFSARNHAMTNRWMLESQAAHALTLNSIENASAIDPQWKAKSLKDIRVAFSASEMERYVGLGKEVFDLKIYPTLPPVAQKTDMSFAKKIDSESSKFDPSSVKVRAPGRA